MIQRHIATELNCLGPYQLLSISARVPPHGSDGSWFQYEITQGTSKVVGVRSGTAAEVEHFLRDMIERLNERRIGKTRPRIKTQQAS